MVKTASTMLKLGTAAPNFSLPGIDGKNVSLSDFQSSKVFVILFICNHCPFVKHIASGLAQFARDYQSKGVTVIGISSNDVIAYPQDNLEAMRAEAKVQGYSFPYLLDEDQSVAKAFHAACTPDIFVFDGQKKLVYRGQFDSSRPGNGIPVTGSDLRAAVDAVLHSTAVPEMQKPSIGCNIKWKPGNEPQYFDPVGVK